MIAHLKGKLFRKAADRLILDVQGVGYEVLIPFSTYYELGEPGEEVALNIYTHVREEALTLFGFLTEKEKQLFLMLIQINGIGPRLGITILSGLPVDEFVAAVRRGDVARLSSIPGVGKKTAERIALELKEKVGEFSPDDSLAVRKPASPLTDDVVSALVNLGYLRSRAESAVSRATEEGTDDRFDLLLKRSLKHLAG